MLPRSREKIEAALGLDPLSLKHLVQFTPEEAVEFARLETLRYGPTQDLVEGINELVPLSHEPPMNGKPNPNDGRAHHEVWIGREYSRVVYLVIHKTYMPDGFPYGELHTKLYRLGKSLGCDEVKCKRNNEGEFKFRFWWD
jgi:hypothetical protein